MNEKEEKVKTDDIMFCEDKYVLLFALARVSIKFCECLLDYTARENNCIRSKLKALPVAMMCDVTVAVR